MLRDRLVEALVAEGGEFALRFVAFGAAGLEVVFLGEGGVFGVDGGEFFFGVVEVAVGAGAPLSVIRAVAFWASCWRRVSMVVSFIKLSASRRLRAFQQVDAGMGLQAVSVEKDVAGTFWNPPPPIPS